MSPPGGHDPTRDLLKNPQTIEVTDRHVEEMKIQITTTPKVREPGASKPASPPSQFEDLRSMGKTALKEMGCRPWGNEREATLLLMLFPGEWYASIPNGFEVTDINFNTEKFEFGMTDDDIRFGCLAYGLLVETNS